jgi:hypothetical protein
MLVRERSRTNTFFMSKLADLKSELLNAKTSIEPQVEGLNDFARLNLQPNTLTTVQAAIVDFQRRLDLIDDTIQALDALMADGYPDVKQRAISEQAYVDLNNNVITIETAFKKFSPTSDTVTVTITAGTPRPKA